MVAKSASIRRLQAVAIAMTPTIALVGCAEGLPLEERIASIRPLAMRVEVLDPAAGPAEPVRAEALPFEPVRIFPFIVDPDGPLDDDSIAEVIDPVWLACPLRPIEGVFACLSSKLPLAPQQVKECPEMSLADLDPDAGTLPPYPRPCRITAGTASRPELTVPIDAAFLVGGDLEVTMVGHTAEDTTTGACLEALLSEASELPDACLFATTRVPVGPDAQIAQLAVDFGFLDPDELGALPDEIPDPDAHPRIQTFTATVLDEEGNVVDVFQPDPGTTINAPLGGSVELETVASELDLQTYVIPLNDTEFTTRQESYTGRWFITWGELLNPTSNDPLSRNTWTLRRGEQDDTDAPPGDTATLFYVLRDDRQGVTWWWFHVVVE